MRRESFLSDFARHHERLFAYIYSLLPVRADAEDVFQKTCMTLWQKHDQYDPSTPYLSWACGVAFYETRNFMRVSGRDRLRFGDAALEALARDREATLMARDERVDALRGCLGKLASAERELLEKVYRDEESVRDLAQRDGKAAQTLYNRLHAIRSALLDCVAGRLAGEGSA